MNDSTSASKIFRALYLSDLEAGLQRTKDEYLALFEGHEEAIAEAHDRMSLDDAAPAGAGMPLPIGEPGDRIGHYEIIRELGRGGQAIVYLAHDDKLNRNVALKVLTRTGPGSESTLQRFEREAEVCSKLDHPSICTVYEADIARGIPFIAMQFVEGDTLSSRIAQTKMSAEDGDDVFFDTSISPGEAEDVMPSGRAGTQPDSEEVKAFIRSFEQAARALHAAHEAEVIHRDIKPGNIMITPDGRPVLLDFGLAQDSNERLASITMTGDFFGTPAYMSPEQLSAHRIRLDRRTDVFSLAVTLYEAVTGTRPFEAATREGLYQAILTKDAADANKVNKAVPRDLAVVLQKAMEKDRDRRYATAGELADELERIRRGEPILARPLGLHQRLGRWVQRNRLAAALIGLLLGVVIGAGIYLKIETDKRVAREVAERKAEERRRVEALLADLKSAVDEKVSEMEGAPINALEMMPLSQKIGRSIPKLPDGGMKFVKELGRSESRERKVLASFLLALIPDDESTEILADLCLDEDDDVRLWASQNILVAEHPQIEDIIGEIYDNTPDEKVRVNSMFALCMNDSPRGYRLAREFVEDESNPRELRAAIGHSATMIRKPQMLPVVRNYLEMLPMRATVAVDFVIKFLERVAVPETAADLLQIYVDEESLPETREAVESAMEKMIRSWVDSGNKDALEALREIMAEEQWPDAIRQAAEAALHQIAATVE